MMLSCNKVQLSCIIFHVTTNSIAEMYSGMFIPLFRETGDVLKDKFDGASEVIEKQTGSRKVLIPTNPKYKRQNPEDLVYLVASPDFCSYNTKAGILCVMS